MPIKINKCSKEPNHICTVLPIGIVLWTIASSRKYNYDTKTKSKLATQQNMQPKLLRN